MKNQTQSPPPENVVGFFLFMHMAKMRCIVLYNIAMDNTYYKDGKEIGKKAASLLVKAPAAVVLYPAGFVVGFVSAFIPERKKQQQPTEAEVQVQEVEVVLNPA